MSARPRRDRRTRIARSVSGWPCCSVWARPPAPPSADPEPSAGTSSASPSASSASPEPVTLRFAVYGDPARRRGLPPAGEGLHRRAPRGHRQGGGQRRRRHLRGPGRPRLRRRHAAGRLPDPPDVDARPRRPGPPAARRPAAGEARRAVRRQLPADRARGVRRGRRPAVHAQRRVALRRLLQQAPAGAAHPGAAGGDPAEPRAGLDLGAVRRRRPGDVQGRRQGRLPRPPAHHAAAAGPLGRCRPRRRRAQAHHADLRRRLRARGARGDPHRRPRPEHHPERPAAVPAGRGDPLRERPARHAGRHPRPGAAAARQARPALRRVPAAEPRPVPHGRRHHRLLPVQGQRERRRGGRLHGLRQRRRGLEDPGRDRLDRAGQHRGAALRRSSPSRACSRATAGSSTR